MANEDVKVWLDYTQNELNRQYEQRELVPNADDYMTKHALLSDDVRKRLKCQLDVAYGPAPDQILDIFPAPNPTGPLVLYFHGGAWTRWHKDNNSYQAPAFINRNITFVSVNFSLVPQVNLDELVRQCRASVKWVWCNAESFNADSKQLFVAGHSSGAHVVGLLTVTDWAKNWTIPTDVIKGAIAASGMYDLEPVRRSSRNDYLELDDNAVIRNSAMRQISERMPPMIIAYGEKEQSEFRRQSRDFAGELHRLGHSCTEIDIPSLNHFEVGEQFADPISTLMQATFELVGV